MRVGKRLFGYFRSGQVKWSDPILCTSLYESPLFEAFICKSNTEREPASGLEPLSCSLRVIIEVLQGFARTCKSRISKPYSLLCLAECCTVLRPRWYQSGINRDIAVSRSCSLVALI